MRRKIIIAVIASMLGFLLYQIYVFFLSPATNLNGIYLVPKDAVLVVETQNPIDNWEDISNSDIWRHLQTNDYFNELTKSLNGFDNVFDKQKRLIDFIGNRSMFISIHVTERKQYDLLYIADLQKIAKLNILKTHLSSFVGEDYKLHKRQYHQHEILEFYDKESRETIFISFVENQLLASFTHTLVENAIDQYGEPVIGRDLQFIAVNKKIGFENMFRLYVQYKYMDSYLNCFFDGKSDLLKNLTQTFKYSGFHFDLTSNNIVIADGYTNTYENTNIYLSALQKTGEGKRSIAKIAPERTALYVSFAFDSFTEFYKNFESVMQEDSTNFISYQNNLKKIEDYLDIDIKKHFISWIDNELALLQMQPTINNQNEMALVFKVKNKELAIERLDYILKKIRKKTPVKFKGVDYKEHRIQFMSIKGFFKVFLGEMFKEFDKPYFSLIDDYIVFTNNPNTLKNIIDDFLVKKTLANSEDYQGFNEQFDSKSSVFAYINTPVLYKSMYSLADRTTKKQLVENKNFIICFPQIGFQLTPYATMFESRLLVSFQDPEVVKGKEQFKEQLEGPKREGETEEAKDNIVEIEKKNVFQTPEILPDNLDADEFVKKYDNGNVLFRVSLENGIPNGKYKEYYLNGKIKLKGRFKEGKQYKVWKLYDENGNLLAKNKF